MADIKTIKNDEKYLRQVSKKVIFPDEELVNDIKVLEDYFNSLDIVLALAAVQLGIPKRLIYLKTTDVDVIRRKNNDTASNDDLTHNEKRVLVNPIIKKREGITNFWEACASCLDNTGLVYRPYKILVEYQDLEGKKHTKTFKGFESTVLSHEMDHLDGILHIDKSVELLQLNPEERKIFRRTHDYNIISETGDFESLEKEYLAKK